MSLPEGDPKPPNYDTITGASEPAAPMSNVPLSTVPVYESPPPPAYYPPTNPAWCPQSVTPPWSLDNSDPLSADPSPPFHKTFLKGKPKTLGILIIMAAILEVALGIALATIAFTNTEASGIPFWGPLFYIIAGSLTVAAHSKPSIRLIKASLSVTTISCVFTVIAVILNVIDLATIQCFILSAPSDYNDSNGNNDFSDYEDIGQNGHHTNNQGSHHDSHSQHNRSNLDVQCTAQLDSVYVVLSLLLVTNLLLFFVTLVLSIFECRSISEAKSPASQVYVISSDVATKKPDVFPEFSVLPAQPPPYMANDIKAVPHY